MTARDERQDDRNGNQDDDDPLEDLHTPADHLIRDLLVDAFERFKLTQNTAVPFVEMEPLRCQTIDARQVLIAQKLEHVVHAFESMMATSSLPNEIRYERASITSSSDN